jgi:pimeloyl-ACP methyl ester carboxylesterase
MVEDVSISSIEAARKAYLETDLKQRLQPYHADPDSAFWGWNDIWLNPLFRDWSIESELAAIRCPLLAVQGLDDEYGTLEQVYGIARRLDQARVVELAHCGHSPHCEQTQELIRVTIDFMQRRGDVAAAYAESTA